MVWLGGLPLAVLLGILGAIGAWEFYAIARRAGNDPLDGIGMSCAAAFPLYVLMQQRGLLALPGAVAAVVLIALLGVSLWARGVTGKPLGAAATTALGAVYAGALLSFAYLLRHHRFVTTPAAGTALVMFPIVLTWASDIGAYFVGRALGKAKLMPSISPGKTKAGAVGALVLTVAVALAYDGWVLKPQAQLTLGLHVTVLFGLITSTVAQVGDLFESMLKREAGVKDSSHLLPGHGGILDRLDSLYFVLPVSFLLLSQLLTVSRP